VLGFFFHLESMVDPLQPLTWVWRLYDRRFPLTESLLSYEVAASMWTRSRFGRDVPERKTARSSLDRKCQPPTPEADRSTLYFAMICRVISLSFVSLKLDLLLCRTAIPGRDWTVSISQLLVVSS
jgi:hypothetical protein